MSRPNLEQLMIIITSFDEKACVKYLNSTGKFYLSNDIWVKGIHGGYNYGNLNKHESTIDECIRVAYKNLQGKLIKNKNNECVKLPKLIKE